MTNEFRLLNFKKNLQDEYYHFSLLGHEFYSVADEHKMHPLNLIGSIEKLLKTYEGCWLYIHQDLYKEKADLFQCKKCGQLFYRFYESHPLGLFPLFFDGKYASCQIGNSEKITIDPENKEQVNTLRRTDFEFKKDKE